MLDIYNMQVYIHDIYDKLLFHWTKFRTIMLLGQICLLNCCKNGISTYVAIYNYIILLKANMFKIEYGNGQLHESL